MRLRNEDDALGDLGLVENFGGSRSLFLGQDLGLPRRRRLDASTGDACGMCMRAVLACHVSQKGLQLHAQQGLVRCSCSGRRVVIVASSARPGWCFALATSELCFERRYALNGIACSMYASGVRVRVRVRVRGEGGDGARGRAGACWPPG